MFLLVSFSLYIYIFIYKYSFRFLQSSPFIPPFTTTLLVGSAPRIVGNINLCTRAKHFSSFQCFFLMMPGWLLTEPVGFHITHAIHRESVHQGKAALPQTIRLNVKLGITNFLATRQPGSN